MISVPPTATGLSKQPAAKQIRWWTELEKWRERQRWRERGTEKAEKEVWCMKKEQYEIKKKLYGTLCAPHCSNAACRERVNDMDFGAVSVKNEFCMHKWYICRGTSLLYYLVLLFFIKESIFVWCRKFLLEYEENVPSVPFSMWDRNCSKIERQIRTTPFVLDISFIQYHLSDYEN